MFLNVDIYETCASKCFLAFVLAFPCDGVISHVLMKERQTMPPGAAVSIPAYFISTSPESWDVKDFLEKLYASEEKKYNHQNAVASWVSSLQHLERDIDTDVSKGAKAKLDRFFNERPSDRIVARGWHEKKKRLAQKLRKSQGEKSRGGGASSTVQHIYHGTVHNAPVKNVAPNGLLLNGGEVHGVGVHNSSPRPLVPSSTLESTSNRDESSSNDNGTDDYPQAQAEKYSERNDEARLEEVKAWLYQVYRQMKNKMSVGDSEDGEDLLCIEDRLYQSALELKELSPLHFCVVDRNTLATILDGRESKVLEQVQSLPAFPAFLEECLSRYDGVQTAAECRRIAKNSPDDDEDINWIDDVMRHVVELITKTDGILLSDAVNEGVWDCLVYPPFWDKYFSTIPDFILQRKEISLLASDYEPYTYLEYDARYDGVFRTRSLRRAHGSRYELCLFETSAKFEGVASRKWMKDRTKLIAGCRAMLYRLQEMVEYDAQVMTKLHVVGVLQAARWNQLFVMSCLNRNVFYLREGQVRELPTRLTDLSRAYDLVSTVWKARHVVSGTVAVLNAYFKGKDDMKGKRTDKEFL